MKLRINGHFEILPEEVCGLQDLIDQRGLAPEKIIVEVNRQIVPHEQWPLTFLKSHDQIEIISFVGGG